MIKRTVFITNDTKLFQQTDIRYVYVPCVETSSLLWVFTLTCCSSSGHTVAAEPHWAVWTHQSCSSGVNLVSCSLLPRPLQRENVWTVWINQLQTQKRLRRATAAETQTLHQLLLLHFNGNCFLLNRNRSSWLKLKASQNLLRLYNGSSDIFSRLSSFLCFIFVKQFLCSTTTQIPPTFIFCFFTALFVFKCVKLNFILILFQLKQVLHFLRIWFSAALTCIITLTSSLTITIITDQSMNYQYLLSFKKKTNFWYIWLMKCQ